MLRVCACSPTRDPISTATATTQNGTNGPNGSDGTAVVNAGGGGCSLTGGTLSGDEWAGLPGGTGKSGSHGAGGAGGGQHQRRRMRQQHPQPGKTPEPAHSLAP